MYLKLNKMNVSVLNLNWIFKSNICVSAQRLILGTTYFCQAFFEWDVSSKM